MLRIHCDDIQSNPYKTLLRQHTLKSQTIFRKVNRNCTFRKYRHKSLVADDFINSFFELNPQAQSGTLSLDELNILMGKHQAEINNRPLSDFDGISPSQMAFLLNQPLSPECILQIKDHCNDALGQIPLLRLSDLLIEQIHNVGSLKLTSRGNLPVRLCEFLHDQQLITWKYMANVKRILEEEIPYLWPLKQYLLHEGIIKKSNNTLSLTKTGEKFIMKSNRYRFENLLIFFGSKFHWGNLYDFPDNGRYGQLGWAFSLVLLAKYGKLPRKSEFYGHKLIQAFERELWDNRQVISYQEAAADFHFAYDVRFFESFAHWFGLEYRKESRSKNFLLRPTNYHKIKLV